MALLRRGWANWARETQSEPPYWTTSLFFFYILFTCAFGSISSSGPESFLAFSPIVIADLFPIAFQASFCFWLLLNLMPYRWYWVISYIIMINWLLKEPLKTDYHINDTSCTRLVKNKWHVYTDDTQLMNIFILSFILSEQLFQTHYPQIVLFEAQEHTKSSYLLLQQSAYNVVQVLCFHFSIQLLGWSDLSIECVKAFQMI